MFYDPLKDISDDKGRVVTEKRKGGKITARPDLEVSHFFSHFPPALVKQKFKFNGSKNNSQTRVGKSMRGQKSVFLSNNNVSMAKFVLASHFATTKHGGYNAQS